MHEDCLFLSLDTFKSSFDSGSVFGQESYKILKYKKALGTLFYYHCVSWNYLFVVMRRKNALL